MDNKSEHIPVRRVSVTLPVSLIRELEEIVPVSERRTFFANAVANQLDQVEFHQHREVVKDEWRERVDNILYKFSDLFLP